MNKLYETLRDANGLKDADIARIAGCSRATITQWKQGQFNLKYDRMKKIADALGVTVDYLVAGDAGAVPVYSSSKAKVIVPILGRVAAGTPISAIKDSLGEVTISKETASKGEHFALKIKGNSMSPFIMDCDTVIVRVQNYAQSNDIVIVQVNGEEAVCKKISFTPNGVVLVSINKGYEPMTFTPEEVISKPVAVIGKVVEVRRPLE